MASGNTSTTKKKRTMLKYQNELKEDQANSPGTMPNTANGGSYGRGGGVGGGNLKKGRKSSTKWNNRLGRIVEKIIKTAKPLDMDFLQRAFSLEPSALLSQLEPRRDVFTCSPEWGDAMRMIQRGETGRIKIGYNPDITFCKENGKCRGRCDALHVCKLFMLNSCPKRNCKYSHALLDNEDNSGFIQNNLLFYLNADEIMDVVRQPQFRNKETIPMVCRFYNKEMKCRKGENIRAGQMCRHLHLCSFFITEECKYGNGCKRTHDMFSKQPFKLLCEYGLSPKDYTEEIILPLIKENHFIQPQDGGYRTVFEEDSDDYTAASRYTNRSSHSALGRTKMHHSATSNEIQPQWTPMGPLSRAPVDYNTAATLEDIYTRHSPSRDNTVLYEGCRISLWQIQIQGTVCEGPESGKEVTFKKTLEPNQSFVLDQDEVDDNEEEEEEE